MINLVVDGTQMVSLVSVHGRGSLFDVNGLLHLNYQIILLKPEPSHVLSIRDQDL